MSFERFQVDFRIEASSVFVAELPLCHVRLQNDRRWPWLVLLPRRPDLREIEDLSASERAQLTEEGVAAGEAVRALGRSSEAFVEKLNWGALGNVVSQLHLHMVGRRSDDPAWPGPVWGFGAAEPYDPQERDRLLQTARAALSVTTR